MSCASCNGYGVKGTKYGGPETPISEAEARRYQERKRRGATYHADETMTPCPDCGSWILNPVPEKEQN